MEFTFKFLVQEFKHGKWVTKFETSDLGLAMDVAHQRHIVLKDRVRVARVDFCELIKYV